MKCSKAPADVERLHLLDKEVQNGSMDGKMIETDMLRSKLADCRRRRKYAEAFLLHFRMTRMTCGRI